MTYICTTGRWLSLCTSVSTINKSDCHDITEILLKVALNTITLTLFTTKSIYSNGGHICWLAALFDIILKADTIRMILANNNIG
jgi:7-keto-8-aminopelargonate synthetase-like enzyme